jgi:hypothetical protein
MAALEALCTLRLCLLQDTDKSGCGHAVVWQLCDFRGQVIALAEHLARNSLLVLRSSMRVKKEREQRKAQDEEGYIDKNTQTQAHTHTG